MARCSSARFNRSKQVAHRSGQVGSQRLSFAQQIFSERNVNRHFGAGPTLVHGPPSAQRMSVPKTIQDLPPVVRATEEGGEYPDLG